MMIMARRRTLRAGFDIREYNICVHNNRTAVLYSRVSISRVHSHTQLHNIIYNYQTIVATGAFLAQVCIRDITNARSFKMSI